MYKRFIIITSLLFTQVSLASVALRRAATTGLRSLSIRSGIRGFSNGAPFSNFYHSNENPSFWTKDKVLSYLQDKGLSISEINIVLDNEFITNNANGKILFVEGGPLELVKGYYESTLLDEAEVVTPGGFIGGTLGLLLGLGLVHPTNNILTPFLGWAIGYGIGKGKRQLTSEERSEIALEIAKEHVTVEEIQNYLDFLKPRPRPREV